LGGRKRVGRVGNLFTFFSEGSGVEQALDLYRKNYRPSEINPKPIATICVWALAADTEEEALRQFKTRKRAIIDRRQSIRLPLMPPRKQSARILPRCRLPSYTARRLLVPRNRSRRRIQFN